MVKVIAEACQNHGGDIKCLLNMVEAAKDAGAWAIKIQSFFAEDLSPSFGEQERGRMKKLELSWEEQEGFVKHCHSVGIVPMTSVTTSRYLPRVRQAGFKHVKVGSAQASDQSMVIEYQKAFFEVYLSTGGMDYGDILSLYKGRMIHGLFHCVSRYPMPWYEANLSRMLRMRKDFSAAVGFSDHSPGSDKIASFMAIVMGASYIERHFTIKAKGDTKDGPVSVDAKELKTLCDFASADEKKRYDEFPMSGLFSRPEIEDEHRLITRYKGRFRR